MAKTFYDFFFPCIRALWNRFGLPKNARKGGEQHLESWSCPRLLREQQQPASHINKSPSESDSDLDWEWATLTPSAHLAINLEKRGQVGAPSPAPLPSPFPLLAITEKDVSGKWGHASPSLLAKMAQSERWHQVRIKHSARAIIKLMPSYDSTWGHLLRD